MLSQKYQQEQKALETKILALNTQLEAATGTDGNIEKWLVLVKQYADLSELTAEV